MYTREEASAVRQKFWISFGKYMSPVPSASFEKVNWVNYKTGIKGISFKLNADKNTASLAVEINLPNKMLQHQYFDVYINFAIQFKNIAGNNWQMKKFYTNENNQEISRIFTEIKAVNIFNENDWPQIISFLKKNIISLDTFWNEYKPAFEIL